ncbi:MAG TPA: TIGR04282 family arsenosugar biosynthesis glycosyltransferase [Planctomycetaceae bacterium]|nr:TIGR04282 family arsenosugar biosynthesis glycosyltransferase [Planctomycetaceae bacterium]
MRALGIFAKQPTPGAVKTRLARDIGNAAATAFYEACLNDLVERFAATADWRCVGYAPQTHEAATYFQKLVDGRYQLWPQPDGDLGRRIEAFFTATIPEADGDQPMHAVLIGSDSPTLPTTLIEAALVALERTDVVLGPAADGGYYLIGARGCPRGWLSGVRWSTPWTLADTVDAAERHGLSLSLLPVWYDIDTADDLAAMWGHLRGQRAADPKMAVTRCEAWLSEWIKTRS